MMRIAVTALVLGFLSAPAALADDAEGKITEVDSQAMTITLDDGSTYKLPAEVDVAALGDGMEVVVAYEVEENGVRQITDMFLPE